MNRYDDIRLVGLTGAAGCGKDTLAGLMESGVWTRVAFADALKDLCIEFLGLSHADVYTQEGKMRRNEFWGMTNREILQRVGTEAMRNGFDKDVWVKMAELKIRRFLSEGRKVMVTDCRFDNEAQMVLRLGGLVYEIRRNGNESNLSESEQRHASEQGISHKYVTGMLLNDRSIPYLKDEFINAVAEFSGKHSRLIGMLETAAGSHPEFSDVMEKMAYAVKCHLSSSIDEVYLAGAGDGNVRLEWRMMPNGARCHVLTDWIKHEAVFEGIEKGSVSSFSGDVDDYYFWHKVDEYVKSGKEYRA